MLSKPFRIITEGDTTDGRVVDRAWIEQMAATYDRVKYGARVWLEHIRGILPDSPFRAYGDVVKLSTEEVTLDGKKLLALTGVVDATPDLLAMHKARQKIYVSAEVNPDFAKSGKAYLAGLAVTDSPASLGTEMMSFAAGAGEKNPLTARKQNPENVFGVAHEIAIEWEPENSNEGLGVSIYNKVKELLGGKAKSDDQRHTDVGLAVTAVAESQKDLLNSFSALQQSIATLTNTLQTQTAAADADRAAFTELKQALDTHEGDPKRPPAAGGTGAKKTDC